MPHTVHLGLAGELRFVEPAHEHGHQVAVGGVEVVAGPVEVGGHGRDEVVAVLAAVELAELDAGDLGQGIALVGRFQGAGEQLVLGDRLVGFPGVDAARAEVEQLGTPKMCAACTTVAWIIMLS